MPRKQRTYKETDTGSATVFGRLDVSIIRELDEWAKRMNKTRSSMVAYLIRKGLESLKASV